MVGGRSARGWVYLSAGARGVVLGYKWGIPGFGVEYVR